MTPTLRTLTTLLWATFSGSAFAGTATDCLFDWAEQRYPTVFGPAAVSQAVDPYYFRFYAGSQSYLGTSTQSASLWFQGPQTGLLDLGPLTDWLAQAQCADLRVQFDQVPAATTTDPYARFEFRSTGASRFECALDDGVYTACSSPWQLPAKNSAGRYDALRPGTHTLHVRALDAAGKTGDIAAASWTVQSILAAGSADFAAGRLIDNEVLPLAVTPQDGWRGIFRINCEFDHAAYDDPIVFPGQPGAAHLHMFYGSKNVEARTTFDDLMRSPAAGCSGGTLNRSAYWAPALLAPLYDAKTRQRAVDADGNPAWQVVKPKVGEGLPGSQDAADAHEVFYYSAAVDDLASIQAPPLGLRIIAGNGATVPGASQSTSVARWHCVSWGSSDANGGPWSSTIPQCKAPDMVRFDIFFPSCWNGKDLDSSNHQDHMAYPVNSGGPNGTRCPSSHPVPVARVSFHYAFPVLPAQVDPTTQASTGWRLASDNYTVSGSNGGLSLHGDWFNAWHPEAMDLLVKGCIQGARDCHDGNFASKSSTGAWTGSLSLGRLNDAKGTQTIPEIVNQGMGEGHHH